MAGTITLYCPTCRFYNTSAAPSPNAHFQSGPLTRHGKTCGQQVFKINDPMPQQRWVTMMKSIEFLKEELDDRQPDSTVTRYVERTIDWLEDVIQYYMDNHAEPMDFSSPPSGIDFATKNKVVLDGRSLRRL